MPKPHKIVNSEKSRDEFIDQVYRDFKEHKYTTYEWKIGADKSLPQNALLHVWLTEYAAHLLKTPKKSVTEEMLDGMKKQAKQMFYQETAESFMVHQVIDPWHPDRVKKAYRSSASWSMGEMYIFLNWLQIKAGQDDLVLESKGQYAKNKRKEIS